MRLLLGAVVAGSANRYSQREIESKQEARHSGQHHERAACFDCLGNHGMGDHGKNRATGKRLHKDSEKGITGADKGLAGTGGEEAGKDHG